MTPQNAENFVKIWRLVSEKFFEIGIILFWAPFTGGPDAKILFLRARRPQLHNKFRAPEPPVLEIWGVKVSTFPPLPPKLGGQILSIFCIGYIILGMTSKNPESFVKVSRTVSAFCCPSLSLRYNSVFYLKSGVIILRRILLHICQDICVAANPSVFGRMFCIMDQDYDSQSEVIAQLRFANRNWFLLLTSFDFFLLSCERERWASYWHNTISIVTN